MNDPICTIPPIDRHQGEFLSMAAISWENKPTSLLDEFIDLTNGSYGQKVAIFDTGIDDRHPLLRGIKIKKKVNSVRSRTGTDDFNGHGTFVAGQIFRRCPQAEFYIYKVLDDNGSGSSSGITSALKDATQERCNFGNASLGAGSRYNPMGEALREWQKNDGLYFAASGNSGGNRIGWPAGWGAGFNVIPTGAYKQGGRRSSFGDYGQVLLCVGAGESIIGPRARTTGTTRMSGTSMGTPSACAETMGYHSARLGVGLPDATTLDAVLDLIESNAVDRENPGKDIFTGFGNLELPNTVRSIKKLIQLPDLG